MFKSAKYASHLSVTSEKLPLLLAVEALPYGLGTTIM